MRQNSDEQDRMTIDPRRARDLATLNGIGHSIAVCRWRARGLSASDAIAKDELLDALALAEICWMRLMEEHAEIDTEDDLADADQL